MQLLTGTGLIGFALIGSALASLLSLISVSVRRYVIPVLVQSGLCFFFGDFLVSIELFVLFAVLLTLLRNWHMFIGLDGGVPKPVER
jgi:hypothetical protein